MMTRTNILKKTFSLCLIGGLTCFVWIHEGWAAAKLAECLAGDALHHLMSPKEHGLPADGCSTNHCANNLPNADSVLKQMKATHDNKNTCLDLLPMDWGGSPNISAVVGVRTDTTTLKPECEKKLGKGNCGSYTKTQKNSDGTRNHEGIDVGYSAASVGLKKLKIYAPAEAIGASFVQGKMSSYPSPCGSGGKSTNVMKCSTSGGMSNVTLTHKRSSINSSNRGGKNPQKNCQTYKTVFWHVINVEESKLSGVSASKPLGKGSVIAEVGGCAGNGKCGYAPHMHYEIRDCDDTLFNPACTKEGALSPLQLCNGTQNVVSPDTSSSFPEGDSNNSAPTNPHLDKMKDCSKMTGEEKTQCEARNEAIKKGEKYCDPSKQKKDTSNQNSSGQCNITKTANGKTTGNSLCKQSGGTITSEITNAIADGSKKFNIPAVVIAAVIQHESGGTWNAGIKSCNGDGGGGLVQFQATTWAEMALPTQREIYEAACPGYSKYCTTCKTLPYKGNKCIMDGGNRAKSGNMCKGKNGETLTEADRFNAYANITCGAQMLKENYDRYKKKGFNDSQALDAALCAHNKGSLPSGCNKSNLRSCGCSSYLSAVTKHYDNLVKYNPPCSLSSSAVGGADDGCEDFTIPAGDHYGSTGDSTFDYTNNNHTAFSSGYECNISANYSSIKGCLFCPLFYTIYKTASSVAQAAHTTLADSFVKLLCVGLAISLAMIIMQYVSSMTLKDPMLLLNTILRKIFVVVLIIVLLKLNVVEFFNMFVTPIFKTGFKLAELAINNSEVKLPNENWAFDNQGLPPEMGLSMLRAIAAVQSRLEQLMAVGSNSICIAIYVKSWHGWYIFPHWGYLLTGLFLWLIAVVFMVCYPFLLIDCVLQFTIASALFPAALAASAFKLTYNYLNVFKVINTFFDAMFVFIFLTIVMFILLAGMDEAVIDNIKRAYESSDQHGVFDLSEIGWFTISFLKLVFFLFLGKAVLEDIPSFASDFAKGLSLGENGSILSARKGSIGRSLGGTAARLVSDTGSKTAGLAWRAGVKPLGQGIKKGYRGIKSGIREARHQNRVNNVRQQASLLASGAAAGTRTANGEAWVSGRTWYGRKIQQRVVKDANGNDILETKRRSLFRNRVVTAQSDGNIKITKKRFKNGKVKETFKMDSLLKNSLIKKDGKINKETLAALQQNSGISQDMLDKAVLHQLMKQRLGGAGAKWGKGKGWPFFFRTKMGSLEAGYTKETINRFIDENGREVFEIRRIGRDGNTTVSRMIKGNNRFLVEQERITKDGHYEIMASDGAVQKKESGKYELNEDGTMKTGSNVIIGTKALKGAEVSADGSVLDSNGNLKGTVDAKGHILDKKGRVIGHANVPDLAFDSQGNVLGKTNADGNIVNVNGDIVAKVNSDGQIIDLQHSGKIQDRVIKEDHIVTIEGNSVFGTTRDGDNLLDKDGNLLGKVKDDGTIIDNNGTIIGNYKEGDCESHSDVAVMDDGNEYRVVHQTNGKPALIMDADNNVVGVADKDGNISRVLGQANVAGLAFDNDGNALGKVTLNGTIVNAEGQEVGQVGNHGAVLDEYGQQIGSMSENSMQQTLHASKTRSKVKFSHSNAFAGARFFDVDGNLNDAYADEEIMFDSDDAKLYARQLNIHGDPKKDYEFGI